MLCPANGESASNACTLVNLALRFGSMPIDIEPPFRPYILSYVATLSFSMDTFSVTARPDTGCDVDGVPSTPTPVQIGGMASLTVYSRSQETQEKQAYTVTINRLLGSETDLQLLRVENSAISPIFSPAHRKYSVMLDLSCDEMRIVHKLRDNEQRIRSGASEETLEGLDAGSSGDGTGPNVSRSLRASEPAAPLRLLGQPPSMALVGSAEHPENSLEPRSSTALVDSAGPRRLSDEVSSGEVQFREDSTTFMLDVGFSRVITITVQCADATQANIGTYRLEVSRPKCSPERPFFDPLKGFCVNYCQSGYYKNMVMNRCSQCNTNCLVCSGLLSCQMCRPDTPDFEYVVQSDGSCRAFENHIFKKYRWWCLGLGALLVFLVLFGCAGICQLCCAGGGSSSAKHKRLRTYDSESEEEELITTNYASKKRLGMY